MAQGCEDRKGEGRGGRVGTKWRPEVEGQLVSYIYCRSAGRLASPCQAIQDHRHRNNHLIRPWHGDLDAIRRVRMGMGSFDAIAGNRFKASIRSCGGACDRSTLPKRAFWSRPRLRADRTAEELPSRSTVQRATGERRGERVGNAVGNVVGNAVGNVVGNAGCLRGLGPTAVRQSMTAPNLDRDLLLWIG